LRMESPLRGKGMYSYSVINPANLPYWGGTTAQKSSRLDFPHPNGFLLPWQNLEVMLSPVVYITPYGSTKVWCPQSTHPSNGPIHARGQRRQQKRRRPEGGAGTVRSVRQTAQWHSKPRAVRRAARRAGPGPSLETRLGIGFEIQGCWMCKLQGIEGFPDTKENKLFFLVKNIFFYVGEPFYSSKTPLRMGTNALIRSKHRSGLRQILKHFD